jgi:predicted deacylase
MALTLFAAPALAQHFSVGTARAARGETAFGAIEVPAGSDAGTTIPVAVVNGARSGPVLALVAGSHGTEYASIVALQRLLPRLDARQIAGTVIVVPLVNAASFREMTVHLNPVDKKNMNRLFPGNARGTQTERALALLAEQVVRPADVVVDLHGGDIDEELRPYSYWFRGGNAAQDSASRALALAFGLDHIIVQDVNLDSPASRGNLSGYTLSLGKTALVAEAGRSATVLSDDVSALVEGTLNAMSVLRMIDRPVPPLEHPVWLDGGARVAAEGDGMFFATVSRGSYVSEGMVVGTLTDFLGRTTADVRAPASGVVTFIRGVPSIWAGATLVNVGRVLPGPPPYRRP